MKRMLHNEYYLSGKKIVEYLRNNQTAKGTLFDRVDNNITPDDHYANTFYALSTIKVYNVTKDEEWLKSAIRVFDYFFDLPKTSRGHKEINNLALLLIYRELKDMINKPDYIREGKLEKELKEMTFNVDMNSTPSNNWLATRACCHALRYYYLNSEHEKSEAEELMNRVLSFQLEDGFFYDYPNIPYHDTYATPLTYHAKTCAMISMYCDYIHNSRTLAALMKGLLTLSKFIAPDGEAFYYGRTNNGIYGYVSAIYAYEQAAKYLENENVEQSGNFRKSALLLFNHLKKWQRKDGHIPICPNTEEHLKLGWDKYMHNTVYNAYTAAFLLIISDIDNAQSKF
jgi:hypothetical protein